MFKFLLHFSFSHVCTHVLPVLRLGWGEKKKKDNNPLGHILAFAALCRGGKEGTLHKFIYMILQEEKFFQSSHPTPLWSPPRDLHLLPFSRKKELQSCVAFCGAVLEHQTNNLQFLGCSQLLSSQRSSALLFKLEKKSQMVLDEMSYYIQLLQRGKQKVTGICCDSISPSLPVLFLILATVNVGIQFTPYFL